MDDPTRPSPPPHDRQRRPSQRDRSVLESPVRAHWTTSRRLGSRLTLGHSEGKGHLHHDGARIDFRSDDGAHTVTGTVTGAAVVRPWAPWLLLALLLPVLVGVAVGMDLWLDQTPSLGGSVAFAAFFWLMLAYQHARTPFVRIDGIDDAGDPIVLHLYVRPSNPYRPAKEAEALAEMLRRAAHDARADQSGQPP